MYEWREFESRMPVADVYSNGVDVCIDLEMPGVDRDDIDISVYDHRLTVKVERRSIVESEENSMYRSERSYSGFYRELDLPQADLESVRAKYRDGVLEIRAPLIERVGRTIEVE